MIDTTKSSFAVLLKTLGERKQKGVNLLEIELKQQSTAMLWNKYQDRPEFETANQ